MTREDDLVALLTYIELYPEVYFPEEQGTLIIRLLDFDVEPDDVPVRNEHTLFGSLDDVILGADILVAVTEALGLEPAPVEHFTPVYLQKSVTDNSNKIREHLDLHAVAGGPE